MVLHLISLWPHTLLTVHLINPLFAPTHRPVATVLFMIIVFDVEYSDGKSRRRFPISTKGPHETLDVLLAQLRVRARLVKGCDVRLTSGQRAASYLTLADLHLADKGTVLVISEDDAPLDESSAPTAPPCESHVKVLGPGGSVETFVSGLAADLAAKASSRHAAAAAANGGGGPSEIDSNDDDDDNLTKASASKDTFLVDAQLHYVFEGHVPWKAFSKRRVPVGGVVYREKPAALSVAYPMQMAQAVGATLLKHKQWRSHSSYVKNSHVSSLQGMSDEVFTRYVNVATCYAVRVEVPSEEHGFKLALYANMLTCRHSCRPTAVWSVKHQTPPYIAVLRACGSTSAFLAGRISVFASDSASGSISSGKGGAAANVDDADEGGIREADEVCFLYPDVAFHREFMLLPGDRRRRVLKRVYSFQCECDRCLERDAREGEIERTLTGAFIDVPNQEAEAPGGSRHAYKKAVEELQDRMRRQFDQLNILTDVDSDIKTPGELLRPVSELLKKSDIARLSEFLQAYRPAGEGGRKLRLHQNHWRISFARLAFITHVVADVKLPVDRFVVEIVLEQISTEACFMPLWHPHRMWAAQQFRKLVARLPDKLAGAVQRRAVKESACQWDSLSKLERYWSTSAANAAC